VQDIINKIKNGVRISEQEALKLYDMELLDLGILADNIRKAKFGKKSYFNINRHINPTNICKDTCKFCAYSATRKNPNPYAMSTEQIVNIAKEAAALGAKEVHVVSAHNPEVGLNWYIQSFSKVKQALPNIHIKALTAAEINFLATEYNKSFEEIIDLMIQNGVDSMPGGGAEIFAEDVRDRICKGKVSSKDWLKIHQIWHSMHLFLLFIKEKTTF